MRILITNDDGILAPGLDVLVRIASGFGETVVVAPDVEKSGVSHAITLTQPLRVREVAPSRFALSGTPADCIFIGLNHILDRRPDMVLSGINRGPNLGYDVVYSGTVGGAMEGTIQRLPAVAFSLVSRDDYPFEDAAPLVEKVLREAIEGGIPAGTMLNVNIPAPSLAPLRGFKVTRLGMRFYSSDVLVRTDPRGWEYLWIGGTRVTMDGDPETDCGAVHEGFVSITPIRPDMMAYGAVAEMGRFRELEVG